MSIQQVTNTSAAQGGKILNNLEQIKYRSPEELASMEKQAGSTASRDKNRVEKSQLEFFKLFLTEVRMQLPDEPLSAKDMSQQMMTMEQTNQTMQTNHNLEKLIELQSSSYLNNALSLIGKEVEIDGNGRFALEKQTGSFSYIIDDNKKFEEITITITDQANKVIQTIKGDVKAGQHNFTWDGKDSKDVAYPDGIYKVLVEATEKIEGAKKEMKKSPLPTRIFDVVVGVNRDPDISLQLSHNNHVPLKNITKIK